MNTLYSFANIIYSNVLLKGPHIIFLTAYQQTA